MILLIVILIILHAFLAQIVDGDSGEIFIFIIFFSVYFVTTNLKTEILKTHSNERWISTIKKISDYFDYGSKIQVEQKIKK